MQALNTPNSRVAVLAMSLLMVLLAGCATAQNAPTGQNSSMFGNSGGGLKLETAPTGTAGQDIEFEQKAYVLGTYKMGETVSLEVPFKSSGSEALEVTDVKPSCTCSKLEWTDSPIPPGQSGVLKANIDTHDMETGEKIKYFMFRYEGDPGVARIKVTFQLEE